MPKAPCSGVFCVWLRDARVGLTLDPRIPERPSLVVHTSHSLLPGSCDAKDRRVARGAESGRCVTWPRGSCRTKGRSQSPEPEVQRRPGSGWASSPARRCSRGPPMLPSPLRPCPSQGPSHGGEGFICHVPTTERPKANVQGTRLSLTSVHSTNTGGEPATGQGLGWLLDTGDERTSYRMSRLTCDFIPSC